MIPELLKDFAVMNSYLCSTVETTEIFRQHIFSDCDEDVYSKLLQIICKSGDEFSKVIQLGVIHQVFCLQKTRRKRAENNL